MASTSNIRTYEATKNKRKPHTSRSLLLAEIDFKSQSWKEWSWNVLQIFNPIMEM